MVQTRKEAAVTQQFAHRADRHEHPAEPESVRKAIERRERGRLPRREGLGTGDNRTVGHDQRQEDAEPSMQLGQVGLEDQLTGGHQCGNDEHIGRDANLRGQCAAGYRHQGVACGEDEHSRQSKTEGIHDVGRHREQWA